MNAACAGCGNALTDTYCMTCSNCAKSYDLLCLNISRILFNNIPKADKDEWLCPCCKGSRAKCDDSSTFPRPTTSAATAKGPKRVIDHTASVSRARPQPPKAQINKETPQTFEMSSLVTELRQLQQEVFEVKQQNIRNLELRNEIASMSESLQLVLVRVKEQSNRLLIAEQNIHEIKLEIGFIHEQLAHGAQGVLVHDLEIAGVIEHEEENLMDIVTEVSRKIGVNLEESDIDDVLRVGPKTRRGPKLPSRHHIPRLIIVKLVRKRKRDDMIKAAKINGNVDSADIVDGEPTRIYFNERLTKINRNLFRQARVRSRQYGYQYCWIRNGGIFLRKADGYPVIRIRTSLDLDEKVGPWQIPQDTASAE